MKLYKACKLFKIFLKYPSDKIIRPHLFEDTFFSKATSNSVNMSDGVISMQSVPDKLYFLLLGLINQELKNRKNLRTDLLVVRSVNASVGTGWLDSLKRWSIINWLFSRQWERAYGYAINGIAYRCVEFFPSLEDVSCWIKSKSIWVNFRSQSDNFSLVINDVDYGDLIVDSFIRYAPSASFNPYNPFVRQLIWQLIRDIKKAERYFGSVKPNLYLSSYSSYIEHGVAVRVALRLGITVWTFGDLVRFGKRMDLKDVYHINNCKNYKSDFDLLDNKEQRLYDAEIKLKIRLSGGVDPATFYMRRSAYKNKGFNFSQELNGATVVFLHDFYDSPHVYPSFVFSDFWSWICFTIETLEKAGINFFLKPHPNQILLSQFATAELSALYPNLKWLESDVNNTQLAEKGIVCGVTVYGTVAHELSYFGIPSICCAQHPHHSFDFCHTAKTRHEYKSMLESAGVTALSKNQMRQQALAFYYMHNLFGTDQDITFRDELIKFWKACNIENDNDEDILNILKNIRRNATFQKLINTLLESINVIDGPGYAK